MSEQQTSSPVSTSGAGIFFEQHVGAYWLAQLLVNAIPPILIDTIVKEVSFQTGHLGWHTDDFLIVCDGTGAAPQKVLGQVKQSFAVSAVNDECVQAIGDFWSDFHSTNFSADNDRLVLVTSRGTNTLLKHFVGLLDCARASRDGAEFEQRLETDGFISNKSTVYYRALQTILAEIEGKTMSAAEIWPFLLVLYVLSLDLHNSTRQTEAHIKNLLAQTVSRGDIVATAAASWNELLSVASTAMKEAHTLQRVDLPAVLRARHLVFGTNEQQVLRALKDHTVTTLRGIRSTIGQDLHLERAALVQKLLAALEDVQVLLVAGAAGSGKSAIGKDTVTILSRDHFVFGFRVEEFAEPHLDRTLSASSVPANAARFGAILAAQDRKVILVESVERLLEKATRDAFSDLIRLAVDDHSMRVILTCRDYSVEQVRASFLQPEHINCSVVHVPPLDDAELMEVVSANPALAVPLKNPVLRDILRNPFFLDKALEIPWSEHKPVPESEREFRVLCWREIVRADHRVPAGMGHHRQQVFRAIAVRRARALSPYVLCNDLDPAVIESLRRDSLLHYSEGNQSLVTIGHDVFEDWAILQWLEEQHLTNDGSLKAFAAAIGTQPALRRAYRRWVAELIESNPGAADKLFKATLSETDVSVQFRDDTLVSFLRAPLAPDFLVRHEVRLLANDRAILKRAIHLLRVACVEMPEWVPSIAENTSILYMVPDGTAWPTVLMLVHRNLGSFASQEHGLLLGLIEAAVRTVTWWAPELDGAEYVASIAHWLLNSFGGYGNKEARKRVLKVIATIPRADPAGFEAVLLSQAKEGVRRDSVRNELCELIYSGMDGMHAARDLPDLIVSVGADYLLASELDIRSVRGYSGVSYDLELFFGIKERLRFDSDPASAIRGPWMPLLQFHQPKALDFFIKVFNHSADWYAHPRLNGPLEPPWEVDLSFADEAIKKQWTNPRLWGLYRGTSMGPAILESMLMALEKCLLEFAEQNPSQLDVVLVDILRRSDSAALAAVVASVATAHPQAAGEALLVLLSVRSYIEIDRSRLAAEMEISTLPDMLPTSRFDYEVYKQERKTANALPHRAHDLEVAAANLQAGPLAPRVHAILDLHLAALLPREQQQEQDRLWRLAIHRMDLRKYTAFAGPGPETPRAKPDETPRRYVRLEPKRPDADVQAMVDEGTTKLAAINARLSVLVWGVRAFRNETGTFEPSQWKEKLKEAKTMDRETDHRDGSRDGPGFVAAVCIRDHWDELSIDQQDWCVDIACSEVLRRVEQTDHIERVQRNPMAADRAGAFVLALLLGKTLEEARMQRVREAFAAALTHPNDEVRKQVASSIDERFWAANGTIALRCVNAIATEASLLDEAWKANELRGRDERRDLDGLIAKARTSVRANFWRNGTIADDAHSTVDITKPFGAEATRLMLIILAGIPKGSFSIAAFTRASKMLVGCWISRNDHDERRDRNFDIESNVSQCLQDFLLRTTLEAARQVLVPVLTTVDRHSRELQPIMQGLTVIQDSRPNTPQYWYLWGLFADAVKRAKWTPHLGDEHPEGGKLLSAVFLTAFWKDNVRHWRFLDGYAHLVHALFEALPPTPIVLDNYVRFLYHIGEHSLPEAFVRITVALQRGDAQKMLEEKNTVFLLEILLQRHVYGRPLELRRHANIREAVLILLDNLVETGSSAAFRMRDDFVTPAG